MAQKFTVTTIYVALLALLIRYPQDTRKAGENIGSASGGDAAGPVWVLFTVIVVSSCVMKLSDIAISVAVERDWVTTIAGSSDADLTRLNLWLRRIDLGCKLVSPLFVGLLTSTVGNSITVIILAAIAVGGFVFEFLWTNVVWNSFEALHQTLSAPVENEIAHPNTSTLISPPWYTTIHPSSILRWIKASYRDWVLFIHSPVFPSSLAISLLYFTTLSFDGSMISWLKTNTYSDPLISGMRGVAVATGLAGTMIMPVLEARIGLARAGSWSIWSEVFSLIPVVVTFFVGSHQGGKAPIWNQVLLFGGMAASRIGLWSFDLCQLKLLQTSLVNNPRRNILNGLQFSLQNILDLLRYVMVIILSQPSQFKYTAALSFGAVVSGACSYLVYLRKERGHIIHTGWFIALKEKFH